LASDFHEALRVSHTPIKGKNHVGCGDAFLAGFVSSLAHGKNIEDCSRHALACATANLYAPYTGALCLRDIRRLRAHVIIKRICPG